MLVTAPRGQKAKDLSRIPFCQAQSLMLIWIKHLLNKDSGRMKDCVEAHCWHHYSDLPHYYLLLFRTGQSLALSNRKHDWNFTPTHIKIFLHTSPATPPQDLSCLSKPSSTQGYCILACLFLLSDVFCNALSPIYLQGNIIRTALVKVISDVLFAQFWLHLTEAHYSI